MLCWGKLSCSPDPGAICWGWCRFHLVYTSMQWPELSLYTALKHNNPLCYLSSLSHPLPSSPGLRALNPALISLSLKPSPLFECLPSTHFSLLYPSVSLPLPSLLPSSPPLITSLGFVRNRSADEGEAIAASALILWKLISRTELQIPPPGTPAFERQGSVQNLGSGNLDRWSWLV